MSDFEKIGHPDYRITGGYLKALDHKEMFSYVWDCCSSEERQAILDLPNFDPEIFKEITGIDVKENTDDTTEV